MATTPKPPTKSAFLRELFTQNPGINKKDADAAWQAAGHEGTFSLNTFYNYKSEFKRKSSDGSGTGETAAVKAKPTPSSKGTKAKKSSKPVEQPRDQANGRNALPEPEARSEPEVKSEPVQAEDQGRMLDELEDGIDDLIFKLKDIGGRPEVLEALRKARRLLYAGQSE